MIYDIILGETLPTKYNYNYIQSIFTNRVDIDEITEYSDLVTAIYTNLKLALDNVNVISETASNVLSEFALLKNEVDNGNDSIIDTKIRELLSALAYSGLEFYMIRRPDLTDTNIDLETTRAYMIDKQDSYFPTINRVLNGTSLTFDDVRDANISTVVIQFLQDMNFNSVVDSAVELSVYKSKYEALEMSHMGYSLKVDRLIQFLEDYGYKFVVVV